MIYWTDIAASVCTHILSEEVVLQRAAGLQPDALLRVLVRQEESVLRSRAQTLDLTQLLPQLGTRLHHRRLQCSDTVIPPCIGSVNNTVCV